VWTGSYRPTIVVWQFPLILILLPFTLTMSDSDGDFSDELLELAGASEKKRKRREGSSKNEAKRRKAEWVIPPCLVFLVPIALFT
jgi:hypothetical protein